MCCSEKENHDSKCGCGCGSAVEAGLWSRAKKIRVLEHYLECLDRKREEVSGLIREHQEEMK